MNSTFKSYLESKSFSFPLLSYHHLSPRLLHKPPNWFPTSPLASYTLFSAQWSAPGRHRSPSKVLHGFSLDYRKAWQFQWLLGPFMASEFIPFPSTPAAGVLGGPRASRLLSLQGLCTGTRVPQVTPWITSLPSSPSSLKCHFLSEAYLDQQ